MESPRQQRYAQACAKHAILSDAMKNLLGGDTNAALSAFNEVHQAAVDMFKAREAILLDTPAQDQIRNQQHREGIFSDVYMRISQPTESCIIDDLHQTCMRYDSEFFQRVEDAVPESLDAELYDSFNRHITKCIKTPDEFERLSQLEYCCHDSLNRDDNVAFLKNRRRLRDAKDSLGVIIVNMICTTGWWCSSLRSADVHSWVAALALIAADSDLETTASFIGALRVWCSRLKDDDRNTGIILLTYLFRWYYATAKRDALLTAGDPLEIIAHFHTKGRKLLQQLTDSEYIELLKRRCFSSLNEATVTTKFIHAVRELTHVWCVHGNGDERRKFLGRHITHFVAIKYKKSSYDRVQTDLIFEQAIDKLSDDVNYNQFFQINLFLSPKLRFTRDVLDLRSDLCYDLPKVSDLPRGHRVMALRAGCGTGKSTAARKLIARYPETHVIICITYRKSLSNEVVFRFSDNRWSLYTEIGEREIDLTKHRRLVIQMESIGRIQQCELPIVLILDEWNSILRQMESGCGDGCANQTVFHWLCRSACRVLAMDGYLDQLRVDVLARYTSSRPFVIHNHFKNRHDHRVFFTSDVERCIQFLIQLLERGERAHVPCFSKKLGATIQTRLNDHHFSGGKKNVLFYHMENRWGQGDDINVIWGAADVVIHTSTIECGLSFERPGHFSWCIGFFLRVRGLIAEAVMQMISRSRSTENFLLCLDSHAKTCVSDLPINMEELLEGMDTKVVRARNREYFGLQGSTWMINQPTISECCPYILMHCTNTLVHNLSQLRFRDECRKLLEGDGAECKNMVFPDAEKKGEKEEEKKEEPVDRTLLCQSYSATPQEVFDGMDPAELKTYNHPSTKHAYANILRLRSEGRNLPDALANYTEKQARCAQGIAVVRNYSSLDLCENSVAATEVSIGLRGPDDFLVSNKIACDLLEFLAGVRDPFAEGVKIFETALRTRLGCSCDNDRIVSDEKKRLILDSIYQWIHIDPCPRTPYRLPGRKDAADLALKTALTLVNHVFQYQFAVKFAREGRKQKRTQGGKPDHLYSLTRLDLFQEKPPVDEAPTKPVLIPWSHDARALVVGDEGLLSTKHKYDKDILTPGVAFHADKRPKLGEGCGYRPVSREDVGTG